MSHSRNNDKVAPKHRQHGFTLIELLVTIVIVGILIAIAVPNYRNHVIHANRANAESFMAQAANKEEQILLDLRQYVSVANNAAFGNQPTTGINLSVPQNVSNYYDLTITATSSTTAAPTYTIKATPNGTAMIDLQCQVLTLDNLGNKGVATNGSVAPTLDAVTCWR